MEVPGPAISGLCSRSATIQSSRLKSSSLPEARQEYHKSLMCVIVTDPSSTQISGKNFLPELCAETAPLQALCCALLSTEQSTFRGGEKATIRWREQGRKRGGQQRGQKGERDA